MDHYPTIRQLQYLVALYEAKNFRKAAEICNITQPTLSAAIKEMENILGFPVIDRSRAKKFILTALGQDVLSTAQKILPEMQALSVKAKVMAKPLSGPIRLGLIPTIAPYLLPKILPPLQQKFPDIDWQIVEGMSTTLTTKLHQNELDLAIMAFPFETPNLEQDLFFEEPFYCAARDNTFKKDQKLQLDDLNNQTLLLLEDGHCLRDHALSACRLQKSADAKALNATSLQTLIQMVEHEYGITLLPEMVVKEGILPPHVTLYSFAKPEPMRKIGAVWRPQDPQIKTIEAILQSLREQLSSKDKTLRKGL